MANDKWIELIELDTRFTPVDPWLALNAIPPRNLIWCLSRDLGVIGLSFISLCIASSQLVPPWSGSSMIQRSGLLRFSALAMA
uniref:Uncharacterized protein n=1 Tax=Oryza meridionalis TaxID=40149 RepID=A0A0E0F7Q0_9ORYZ